ncbi:unnamed protein product [Thelazia callipaeda]|uniref:BTB domain-containing protein n=1 Tax=Thelazia callipaeda TaxID=103827 RepID=A0A0N5CJ35_THECL|nr:unnamed protein product [Thelazia callipaeda]
MRSAGGRVSFRYIWTTKVLLRQINDNEAVILRVSPKFATVHGYVAFQWSLQMRGTVFVNDEGDKNSADQSDEEASQELDYVSLSLYFNDGPVPVISDLRTTLRILENKKCNIECNDDSYIISETMTVNVLRGKETELAATKRFNISNYIKENVGRVIRLSIVLNFCQEYFDASFYLKIHHSTSISSFLTTNYRARASSKVFKRRSRKSKSSDNLDESCNRKLSLKQEEDFEEIFNQIMNQERERREKAHSVADFSSWKGVKGGPALVVHYDAIKISYETVLFKKLLTACCNGCQRKAKLLEEESLEADLEETDEMNDESTFECNEQNQEGVHEVLANMFFTKVAMPEMDYVEDFADFLIDVELNKLCVLKRACENYLCNELRSKKDLITSLLLDLLFLTIVFNLPILKSMTLSELSNRPEELNEPHALLALEEYKSIDRRMKKLSGRNLIELIEEVKRFREQRLRTQLVHVE